MIIDVFYYKSVYKFNAYNFRPRNNGKWNLTSGLAKGLTSVESGPGYTKTFNCGDYSEKHKATTK